MTEPTDRSTPRTSSTKVMPIAMTATFVACVTMLRKLAKVRKRSDRAPKATSRTAKSRNGAKRNLPDGRRRRSDGGAGFTLARARRRAAAHLRSLRHAEHQRGQHQRARHDAGKPMRGVRGGGRESDRGRVVGCAERKPLPPRGDEEPALPGWSSLLPDGESQLSEHPYGACLSALEVARAKSLASGELISCAQDCFRRVKALFPGELISRGGSETMLGEEPLRPQSVVLSDLLISGLRIEGSGR